MEFRVGDRVKDGFGNIGTVVEMRQHMYFPIVVRWDTSHSEFGECQGTYTLEGRRYRRQGI